MALRSPTLFLNSCTFYLKKKFTFKVFLYKTFNSLNSHLLTQNITKNAFEKTLYTYKLTKTFPILSKDIFYHNSLLTWYRCYGYKIADTTQHFYKRKKTNGKFIISFFFGFLGAHNKDEESISSHEKIVSSHPYKNAENFEKNESTTSHDFEKKKISVNKKDKNDCYCESCFNLNKVFSTEDLDDFLQDFSEIEEILKGEKVNGWVKIATHSEVHIFKRALPNSHLSQYKVFGVYTDLSAVDYYDVQLDLDYRKEWDESVVDLRVLEIDEDQHKEIVYWRCKFPYPMSNREYIYERRYQITDDSRQLMAIVSNAIHDHPKIPHDDSIVRVTDYKSTMLIKPHSDFNELGMNFILTYYDDPRSDMPRIAQSWAAASGIPEFIKAVHKAAKEKREKGNFGCLECLTEK